MKAEVTIRKKTRVQCEVSLRQMQEELERLNGMMTLTKFGEYCKEQDEKGIKEYSEWLDIMDKAGRDYIYLVLKTPIPFDLGDTLFSIQ